MDKKDLNGNEELENITEPEVTSSEATEAEVTHPEAEIVASETETEPVNLEPAEAAPAAVTAEESVPVMNKVGAGAPTPPSAPKSGKGWMAASIVLAAALVVVLIVQPFQKNDSKTAVATVNGSKITKEQLYDKLVEAGGETTLDNLITTTLVDQEAEKAGVTVTDADINQEIEDLKTQFGGEEALNSALAQSSMTMDDLKAQMPLQVKIRKILEPKVVSTITDDDIKKYYDDNKASFNQEEEVRASHILVQTKEEADAILKQLKDGADFATLAKEKSADTGSKDNGGDLDFFKRGDMVAEFSDAAFKLKVGETSGAVKTEYGYHIIKVTDRKEAHEYTLDEKKDEIKKTLISQKVSEMSTTWMSDLKTNSKITNTLTDKPEASAAASDAPAASAEPTASEAPATE